jgi:hypothetical protein
VRPHVDVPDRRWLGCISSQTFSSKVIRAGVPGRAERPPLVGCSNCVVAAILCVDSVLTTTLRSARSSALPKPRKGCGGPRALWSSMPVAADSDRANSARAPQTQSTTWRVRHHHRLRRHANWHTPRHVGGGNNEFRCSAA